MDTEEKHMTWDDLKERLEWIELEIRKIIEQGS